MKKSNQVSQPIHIDSQNQSKLEPSQPILSEREKASKLSRSINLMKNSPIQFPNQKTQDKNPLPDENNKIFDFEAKKSGEIVIEESEKQK